MEEENLYFENEYEKDLLAKSFIISFETVLRLLTPENSDAFLLYSFYIKTAKIQNNTSVYATNKFCKKGLGWGDNRFYKAKKILTDSGLIVTIKRKENGKIIGHYVKIGYIKNQDNQNTHFPEYGENQSMDETIVWENPEYGKSTSQNTIYKKRNTIDKNLNTTSSTKKKNTYNFTEIFEFWNSKNIVVHKKLNPQMKANITKALKLVSEDELKESISNYSEILRNDKYYFTWKWSLTDFLARGLSKNGMEEHKGFWMFLSSANPFVTFSRNKNGTEDDPFTELRNKFSPITVLYNKTNILDKVKNTYLGFETETLINPINRLDDLEWTLEHKRDFDFHTFCDLEIVIAHLFYTRKNKPNLEDLKKYFEIWLANKDRFKKEARQLVKERYT